MAHSHSPVPSLVKHCWREPGGLNCPHRRCCQTRSLSALTAALCFTQNIPATCAQSSHSITLQSWACHGAAVRNKRWHCPGKFIGQHLEPLLVNNNNKLCKGPCPVLFQDETVTIIKYTTGRRTGEGLWLILLLFFLILGVCTQTKSKGKICPLLKVNGKDFILWLKQQACFHHPSRYLRPAKWQRQSQPASH